MKKVEKRKGEEEKMKKIRKRSRGATGNIKIIVNFDDTRVGSSST